MGRLVDLLGRTDYRVIISLGPQKGSLPFQTMCGVTNICLSLQYYRWSML